MKNSKVEKTKNARVFLHDSRVTFELGKTHVDGSRLVSLDEIAQLLDIPPRVINKERARGRFPLPQYFVRDIANYRLEDVEAWIEKQIIEDRRQQQRKYWALRAKRDAFRQRASDHAQFAEELPDLEKVDEQRKEHERGEARRILMRNEVLD